VTGAAGAPPAPAEVLYRAPELGAGVTRLAREVAAATTGRGTDLVLVAVLKGSLLFVADLARAVGAEGGTDVEIDFLAISAYAPGTGRVRLVKDLDVDVAGRDVVIVEDVVDTGLTLGFLLGELGRRGPASLRVCTLFDRPARRILPVPVDHVGFEVPDAFLLGYGLDYAGRYRNLPMVAVGDLDALRVDPDVYVPQLYG
jgi:hypoxanthine phosphoribosyltransferase